MSDNAEVFLGIFNEVEKFLKNNYNQGKHTSFRYLLVKASRFHPIIKKYKNDLITYGDLRNAIMHNFEKDGEAIAVPRDKVVAHFSDIWDEIKNPTKVDIFFKEVFTCDINDKLDKALELVHEHKISQIPILENNRIIDVLNSLQIVEWMAGSEKIIPSETMISTVLINSQNNHNFAIIPDNYTVFQAAEMYKQSFKQLPVNRYFDALLITRSGIDNQALLGIIVLKDIATYLN
jgi:predicted transcriptional regulator